MLPTARAFGGGIAEVDANIKVKVLGEEVPQGLPERSRTLQPSSAASRKIGARTSPLPRT
jgi:hypothetical protein